MSSQINSTKPTSGNALTSDVRSNFGHAASELNSFFRMSQEYKSTTGGPVDYQVAFDDAITLIEGDRFTIHIQNVAGKTNTTTAPRLSVDAGSNFYVIKSTTGQPLNIGDLQQNGIYDIFWDGANFRAVNVFREDTALFTAILGATYPVNSIIHSKSSTNPGTGGYFFAGVSFGTWQLYSQGRAIMGVDQGLHYPNTGSSGDANVSSAAINSTTNLMTVNTTSAHNFSVGDTAILSGFDTVSSVDPDGSRIVTSVPTSTTFTVEVTGTTGNPDATGTDRKAINARFNTGQEIGGSSTHSLTSAEMNHNHQWHSFASGTENERIEVRNDNDGTGSYNANADLVEFPNGASLFGDYYTDNNRDITGADDRTPFDTISPYIATYIWVRTA